MEAMAPGHGVGGLLAAACFLLLFWSHYLGGTAGWLQVVLFFSGLACIAVEIFLLPGTVVPGLVGASMILVSLVMADQGFLIPQTTQELHTLAEHDGDGGDFLQHLRGGGGSDHEADGLAAAFESADPGPAGSRHSAADRCEAAGSNAVWR